jgi:hypothetical protein
MFHPPFPFYALGSPIGKEHTLTCHCVRFQP